jgi:dTDP-4-dehydrorhamnose reductase
MRPQSNTDILVLGGTGMLGHKMFQRLRKRFPETYCMIRGSIDDPSVRNCDLLRSGQVFQNWDLTDFNAFERFFLEHKPRVVVNCVGIIKHRPASTEAVPSILTNALLPHQLSRLCGQSGARLITFSTDCVFSGKRGNYREGDPADAQDLYGRTKSLGELANDSGNALTLRTSIIGRELVHSESLLEWLLDQNHRRVYGYKRALFSGVTTHRLADLVGDLIEKHPNLCGLYHVAGQTISKFDLLCLLRETYELDIEILPDEEFVCDRSLRGDKLEAATGYLCPPWPELVDQLGSDQTPYDEWRTVKNEVL